jgi:hypothetical protein
MTVRHFFLETRSLPPLSVRSAMVHALAELVPTRLNERPSYSTSHDAVLDHLHHTTESPFAPTRRRRLAGNGEHARSSNDTAEEVVRYRRLAVRVIERAFKDMIAPACAAGERESAREFLAGSPMLFLWCGVAALDPHRVIAYATRLESWRARAPVGLERG